MVTAKKYILAKHFDGLPKATDLKIVEENLPPLKDGEFLAEAVFLSVDPFLRVCEPRIDVGSVFIGLQVAKIVESKSPKYPVGKYVVGEFGWRTHTISDGSLGVLKFPAPWVIRDIGDLPLSLAIGTLGLSGNSAYFGFLEICKPKAGETVVISGAAGAVGSHVGQIAKIKGCKVIGIAGDDAKGKWLVDELGFNCFINYKTENIWDALTKYAPKGVDCYFDNVGGVISSTVLGHMNEFGRISVCGSIIGYNSNRANWPSAPFVQDDMIEKQLKMEGFIVHRWLDRWYEGIEQNLKWIKEGKLKYKETVTNGFENTFTAFLDQFEGANVGKSVVKL